MRAVEKMSTAGKVLAAFAVLLLIVILILVVWLYVRASNQICCLKEEVTRNCSVASQCNDQCSTLEHQLQQKNCALQKQIQQLCKKQHSLLGLWGVNIDELFGSTPFTLPTAPMLLSAPTPQNPQAFSINVDSQASGSSTIPEPYDGTVQALSIELPGPLTAGSLTFTLTVNDNPTPLTETLTSSSQVFAVRKLDVPFSAGDRLGITYAATGATLDATYATLTAQLFGTFRS